MQTSIALTSFRAIFGVGEAIPAVSRGESSKLAEDPRAGRPMMYTWPYFFWVFNPFELFPGGATRESGARFLRDFDNSKVKDCWGAASKKAFRLSRVARRAARGSPEEIAARILLCSSIPCFRVSGLS